MPNLASVYSASSGRQELNDEISPDGTIKQQKKAAQASDDAARRSAKQGWLGSTITQELLKDLRSREVSNIDSAIALATNSPRESYEKIISLLVRVHEIREITNTTKQ